MIERGPRMVERIDEDSEKILGLLNYLSGIFIPYIYTACREEFSLGEEFSLRKLFMENSA